jgi:hypothetical protein
LNPVGIGVFAPVAPQAKAAGLTGTPAAPTVRWDVKEHKFKIGQLVYFHPKGAGRIDPVPGPYQITKRLPAAKDGEFQYEIRSNFEEHDRVARESELTRT